MLLRQATRGGNAGRGQYKKRFLCVQERDFGELVSMLMHDKQVKRSRGAQRQPSTGPADPAKKTRSAVSLISKGYISKAANRMTSHGVASTSDQATLAALKAKP